MGPEDNHAGDGHDELIAEVRTALTVILGSAQLVQRGMVRRASNPRRDLARLTAIEDAVHRIERSLRDWQQRPDT